MSLEKQLRETAANLGKLAPEIGNLLDAADKRLTPQQREQLKVQLDGVDLADASKNIKDLLKQLSALK